MMASSCNFRPQIAPQPLFHFSSPKTITDNSGLIHWHWIVQNLNKNVQGSMKKLLDKVNSETFSQFFALTSVEDKL